MRAIRVTSPMPPELAEEEIAQPQPGAGEVLIRVYAAGVTPSELLWYPTTHAKAGGERNLAVPGHEFSGVVAALGDGVTGVEAGQEVFGMNDWHSDGAMAEYCVTSPSAIAPKPPRLTHVEAASVPIAALTAWQGLFDRAKLQVGEWVLVHGGAGAVGMFAVQLARRHGAHVAVTVSQRDLDFVGSLGAERVIDYRSSRFEESMNKVDVVFDTVGGETLARSWSVLKPGGRMVTIATTGEGAADDRVKRAFFIVEPNGGELAAVGELLEKGDLQPMVDVALPLAQAPAIYRGEAPRRRGRGKVVVVVADPQSAGG